MKKIIFRRRAVNDLEDIQEYYSDVAPGSVSRVLRDIFRSIDLLSQFPHAGMSVPDRDYRRIVTIKYHYIIIHEVVPDAVNIIGIYRYQNRES